MTAPKSRPALLRIEDLHVEVEGKPVLQGVDLEVPEGEVHALMGRNGSGKSSLSAVIMGHPNYVVTRGRVLFDGEDLATLAPEERARRGLFLAFQYPVGIPGVAVHSLVRESLKAVRGPRGLPELGELLDSQMGQQDLAPDDWEPQFVDYLYLSFTNAMAFSPTDTLPLSRWAKFTMLVQSLVSLLLAVLVIARAVNILR